MDKVKAQKIATEIVDLYHKHGHDDYIGEDVTQLQHAFQSAEHAKAQDCDDEMVLAAFLHDIGHICVAEHNVARMDGYGVLNHEKIGAAFLRIRRFSERLVKLVQAHVAAKRYLTYKDAFYYNQLSEASKQTLLFQGGKMSYEEAVEFESDQLFQEMITMRRIDELAKEDLPPSDLQLIYDLIVDHLTNQENIN